MNNTINRIARIVFGSALIAITLAVNTAPLGGFALLPLIAIPVILSGLFGENLLGELLTKPVTATKQSLGNFIAKFSHVKTKAA
jgi:hypothetical protein